MAPLKDKLWEKSTDVGPPVPVEKESHANSKNPEEKGQGPKKKKKSEKKEKKNGIKRKINSQQVRQIKQSFHHQSLLSPGKEKGGNAVKKLLVGIYHPAPLRLARTGRG